MLVLKVSPLLDAQIILILQFVFQVRTITPPPDSPLNQQQMTAEGTTPPSTAPPMRTRSSKHSNRDSQQSNTHQSSANSFHIDETVDEV